jgi:hypothetical protein
MIEINAIRNQRNAAGFSILRVHYTGSFYIIQRYTGLKWVNWSMSDYTSFNQAKAEIERLCDESPAKYYNDLLITSIQLYA